MSGIFQSKPLWPSYGLAFARIITGALMAYHGYEVFQPDKMNGYMDWDAFKSFPSPEIAVYIGKSLELLAGILLLLGYWTRLASLLLIGVMGFVTFFVGQGKFWYEDQHPFMFVILGWIFLCCGPGALSLGKKK